jgi:hypothetical protein
MAAMLVKNALQLSLRARPGAVGVCALSSISTGSFSACPPHPAVLMMATPTTHMSAAPLLHTADSVRRLTSCCAHLLQTRLCRTR